MTNIKFNKIFWLSHREIIYSLWAFAQFSLKYRTRPTRKSGAFLQVREVHEFILQCYYLIETNRYREFAFESLIRNKPYLIEKRWRHLSIYDRRKCISKIHISRLSREGDYDTTISETLEYIYRSLKHMIFSTYFISYIFSDARVPYLISFRILTLSTIFYWFL